MRNMLGQCVQWSVHLSMLRRESDKRERCTIQKISTFPGKGEKSRQGI